MNRHMVCYGTRMLEVLYSIWERVFARHEDKQEIRDMYDTTYPRAQSHGTQFAASGTG